MLLVLLIKCNYVMACYDCFVLGCVEIRKVIKFNVNVVYMCYYSVD